MSQATRNTRFTVTASIFAGFIYLMAIVIPSLFDATETIPDWLSSVCWIMLVVQTAFSVAWDEMVMGDKPVAIGGVALTINLFTCIMAIITVDQRDVGYALIGITIMLAAVSVRTVMKH